MLCVRSLYFFFLIPPCLLKVGKFLSNQDLRLFLQCLATNFIIQTSLEVLYITKEIQYSLNFIVFKIMVLAKNKLE